MLLVGTAPADLAHRGTSAAAAGFVNFMGYMGAATGDVVTGYYSSPSTRRLADRDLHLGRLGLRGRGDHGHLVEHDGAKVGLLRAAVPKLGARLRCWSPPAWRSPSGPAVHWRCGLRPMPALFAWHATFVNRWAALPALVVAALGLLAVFSSLRANETAGHLGPNRRDGGLWPDDDRRPDGLVERKDELCE